MRTRWQVGLTLGLMLLLAGPALAQQQKGQRGQGGRGGFGMGMGMGGGFGFLVNNEGVQKELKLDQEQVDKLKQAVQSVMEKHADDFATLRDASPEERREKGQEIGRKVNDETLAAVNDILKPDQLKRLKEIELQQAGTQAFARPDVEKALKLTSDQKDKIKTISEDAAKEIRASFGGGGGGGAGAANPQAFQAAREKMNTVRKESLERVLAVLNDDQKTSWKEMTGKPFEVTFQPRRRQGQ